MELQECKQQIADAIYDSMDKEDNSICYTTLDFLIEPILEEFKGTKENTNGDYVKPMLGEVLTYGLSFDKNRLQWVTIEATKYDEQRNVPITWAVYRGGYVMSKFTGNFDYEPMPSSRDYDFFNEYRFSTPDEAAECWSNHSA